MNDLISRQALLEEYDRLHVGEPGMARKLIEDAPSVQPEQKREKWEEFAYATTYDNMPEQKYTEFVLRIYTDGRVERLEDITRCGECKHYGDMICKLQGSNHHEFCSFAERKGEDG
jgi:hypothetical protein